MAELRRLAHLARLCKTAGEGRGLTMRWWAVMPDIESDAAPTNRVRIIYSLDEAFGLPSELAEMARSLAEPTHDPEEAERRKRQVAEEAAALARKLNDPKGGIL